MTGYGYYDFERHGNRWEIVLMIEFNAEDIVAIDDHDVFIFGDQRGEWWIGALWDDQQESFEIKGPYQNGEEAFVMMRLLGSK